MLYFTENLKNWLLGKSEIDNYCPAIPPAEDNPEKLLELYAKAINKGEIDKINKKLSNLGYEVKVIHLLQPKIK